MTKRLSSIALLLGSMFTPKPYALVTIGSMIPLVTGSLLDLKTGLMIKEYTSNSNPQILTPML